MTVLVSDSFNRANSTTSLGTTDSYNGGTAKTWTAVQGTWGINGNQAYPVTATNDGFAIVDAAQANVKLTVTSAADTANTNGFYFRYVDVNNYWRFIKGIGQVYLQKRVSGSNTTVLNPTGLTFANGDILSLTANGSTIEIFLNGVSKGSVTDTTHQTATKHGIGMQATNNTDSRFDNFQIEDFATGGTTYSGSGTASGSSSASSAETLIAAASGTASGSSAVSSNETEIYSATGTAQGVSSVAGSPIVIYVATGSADGSSNVSGNPIAILVASGTAQGSSSVIDSAGGTTYSGAGTASGGSAVNAVERMIYAARGTAASASSVSGAEIVIFAGKGTAIGVSSVSGHEVVVLVANGTAEGSSSVVIIDGARIIGRVTFRGDRTLRVTFQASRELRTEMRGDIAVTVENQNTKLEVGESRYLDFIATDNGQILPLDGATIKWVMKKGAFTLSKDTTSGITITDPANGLFTVEILKEDTANFSPGLYPHEAVVFDALGHRNPVSKGNVTLTAPTVPVG